MVIRSDRELLFLLTAFDDIERHVVILTAGWHAGMIRDGVSFGTGIRRA